MTNLNLVGEPIRNQRPWGQTMKQSRIPIVKVRRNSQRCPEYTWVWEDQMQLKYPHLFTNTTPETNTSWIQGLNSFLGGRLSQITISGHFPNPDNLLFTSYYSSFHYLLFLESVWHFEKCSKILLFTWHYSFPEGKHYSWSSFIFS